MVMLSERFYINSRRETVKLFFKHHCLCFPSRKSICFKFSGCCGCVCDHMSYITFVRKNWSLKACKDFQHKEKGSLSCGRVETFYATRLIDGSTSS
jgi:hypothetical protein